MTFRLESAIPVLPVRDLAASVAFYREKLGFRPEFEYGRYGGVRREPVELHLDAESAAATPVSVRVAVSGIDELYAELQKHDVIHPQEPLATMPWGMRQFSVLDPDGNRITFAQAAR